MRLDDWILEQNYKAGQEDGEAWARRYYIAGLVSGLIVALCTMVCLEAGGVG